MKLLNIVLWFCAFRGSMALLALVAIPFFVQKMREPIAFGRWLAMVNTIAIGGCAAYLLAKA